MAIKHKTAVGGGSSNHPIISLTDFVDFIAKTGNPKLTQVKTVKWRKPYSPGTDFWRPLRLAVVDYHEDNGTKKAELDQVLDNINPKQAKCYSLALKGYQKFLGRKKITWDGTHTKQWNGDLMSVRVNPELGVTINGKRHIMKLYFKAEPLTKAKADLILLLMAESLGSTVAQDTEFALLDVQKGKLYSSASPSKGLLPLLEGEANSFATMWNAIPDTRPGKESDSENEDAA